MAYETYNTVTHESIQTFDSLKAINPAFLDCTPEFMADPWSCFTDEAYAPTEENPNGTGWPAEHNWPKGVGVRVVETSDPPMTPPIVYWKKIDFLNLFTRDETITILNTSAQNNFVRYYQYLLDNSTDINLADPRIIEGVSLLELGGLIAHGRGAKILAGEAP